MYIPAYASIYLCLTGYNTMLSTLIQTLYNTNLIFSKAYSPSLYSVWKKDFY